MNLDEVTYSESSEWKKIWGSGINLMENGILHMIGMSCCHRRLSKDTQRERGSDHIIGRVTEECV